ncbi:MAG: hypothetical protein PHS32_20950 [Rhodoferax sp.]|uniref:hypothetical protein n=1 Tax=Rhodoferax sp. TaxID=50421 RepID=UPI0026058489|nr:hypothetical protein [Rhodoferax sp.]MDD5336212.1 hypothetical protein [Rhodoferax sp.]
MTKTKLPPFLAKDVVSLASLGVAQKLASSKKPAGKTQLNVLLDAGKRKKFRAIALAWDTTERALLEAFIDQLPDVTPQAVAAPKSVAWAKPPKA